MSISIAILLIVIFSFLTFFIAYFFGSSIFKKKYGDLNELELKIVDAKRRLETSKKEVEREIESFRKEETLKVKEERFLKLHFDKNRLELKVAVCL